ncbi:MAG: RsmE family RNA methyltransferase, partial [Vicinamibacterales bacterium]
MPTPPARVRPRFLAPDLDPGALEAHLPADESRHLTRVLRLGVDALVSVFDGRGRECLAQVVDARDSRVTLRILQSIVPVAAPAVPLTLVQAVLKGTAMDDVVRDATMMGAVRIQPLLTEHVTVKPALAMRAENVERWRRIAIASAKQSRRATIPEIAEPVPLERALSVDEGGLRLIFVEPSAGRETRSMRSLLDRPAPSGVTLVIGPEGGWAVEEIDLAIQHGALAVSLGALTLRADAMPIAAIAALRTLW